MVACLFVICIERQWHDARIVDHDIDASKCLNSRLTKAMHLLPTGDIGCYRNGVAT